MNNIEIRSIEQNVQFDEESRVIEGYAVVFNSQSVLMYENNKYFYEYIQSGAITQEVIDNSDVVALFNHDEKRGYLGRSKNGQGTLLLSIDDYGLKFRFEAPHTSLGDEVLEYVKRGDVTGCSFGFQIVKGTDKWEPNNDGTYNRYIPSICNLTDISVVLRPAYQDTEVALRSLEEYIETNNMTEQEKNKVEEEEVKAEVIEEPEVETKEETQSEKENEEEVESRSEDEKDDKEGDDKPIDTPEDEPEHDKETEQENKEESEEDTNKEEKRQINKDSRMEKFNLLRAINAQVNNKPFAEADAEVITRGIEQMREMNLSNGGSIVLPVETRATVQATVATHGQEFIPTETGNIVMPLRSKLVAVQAGATFLNLTANLKLPTYSGSNVTWEGEVAEAKDGAGTFGDVTLKPQRLTAYVDVSKLSLIQANEDVEALLISDIYDALAQKLESTIFGNGAGKDSEGVDICPVGLLNGAGDAADLNWTMIVNDESTLEGANYGGEFKYVVAPSAKAKFKSTTISGTKSDLRMIQDGNTVNGYEVLSTTSVPTNGVLFGSWKELMIAQFGGIEITVDPVSQAHNGKVRLVVNGYFDAKLRRPNAVVKHILA